MDVHAEPTQHVQRTQQTYSLEDLQRDASRHSSTKYTDRSTTGELYVKKTTLQFQGLGNFLTEQVA